MKLHSSKHMYLSPSYPYRAYQFIPTQPHDSHTHTHSLRYTQCTHNQSFHIENLISNHDDFVISAFYSTRTASCIQATHSSFHSRRSLPDKYRRFFFSPSLHTGDTYLFTPHCHTAIAVDWMDGVVFATRSLLAFIKFCLIFFFHSFMAYMYVYAAFYTYYIVYKNMLAKSKMFG